MFRAKSGRSLFFENKEDSIHQNKHDLWSCGSDFRLKKLYLFLHIFLTFCRENSRLGTSPPMMKSVWSHLKEFFIKQNCLYKLNGFIDKL